MPNNPLSEPSVPGRTITRRRVGGSSRRLIMAPVRRRHGYGCTVASSDSSRSGRGRALAVIAVVAATAAVVGGLVWQGRGSAGQRSGVAYPLPSASGPVGGSTTAAPSATGATPTCAPGEGGPLRQDTQFTAKDAAATVVPYSISLPDDYYTACKQYPVIYALHGKTQNNAVFLEEALSLRKAMAAGVLEQSIIVTPDSYSTGRWENLETGPAEDNFIERLIPFVEQTYRVRPGGAYRLLVGFSMGGHGAIRFGLKYPQRFAAVWSVDGAMAGTEDYLPFVEGRSTADFRIISVGGQLNGDRVRTLVDGLRQRGVEIPYVYQDLEHEFVTFVEADEKGGWQAMKYLQQNLGRAV
jgi:enterochelin esterase-like enzyme